MTEVIKLSLLKIGLYFVIYLIAHYLIIKAHSKKEVLLKTDSTNEKLQKEFKILSFLRKWFAGIYVIILIIMLM